MQASDNSSQDNNLQENVTQQEDVDSPKMPAQQDAPPKEDENLQENAPKASELIFPLDSKPSFGISLIAAFQHILSMVLSVMAPPAIVAGALGLDGSTISYLVSMSLFFAGIGILVQVTRPFGIGSGMLSIQATSFCFPGALISIGTYLLHDKGLSQDEMMATLFCTCFLGGLVVMLCSRFIRYLQKVITHTVAGVTVMMIGISLIGVGADSFAGGKVAQDNGTFGDPIYLGLGALVFLIIFLCNRAKSKLLRMAALMIGVIGGFLIAIPMGLVDWSILSQPHHWFEVPIPFKFGFFAFDLHALLVLIFLFVMVVIEAIGDLTATSAVSEQPTEGELYQKRITGGIMCDGLITSLGAIFGCFPAATFSQNNGVIQLSGVASRKVGKFCGVLFLIFALCPFIVVFFQLLPAPVLGGALLILFGSIACSGIRILLQHPVNRRESLIIAASLSIGIMAMVKPDAFAKLPDIAKTFFDSPIVAGGVSAMLFHLLLPKKM